MEILFGIVYLASTFLPMGEENDIEICGKV